MSSTTNDRSHPAAPPFERLRDYRLLCSLGHGGMGEVYLAEHERLERRVAIKLLPRGRDVPDGAIARFEREMKAVGRLQHPHIVQALDAGREGDVHYLVLEYVDGGDLSRVADAEGTLSVADACEAIRQVATGLEHARESGLVHRDVKPSNMLLGRDGTVKLLDLGLALLKGDVQAGELTDTGQIVGTLDYIAPEQIEDTHAVDIRADLYSLGCALYRLLCGRAPFAGEEHRTAVAKIRAHVSAVHPPLNAQRPDLPNELVAIVDRLLAKDPHDRYAAPAEVAKSLEPYTDGADLVALAERACPPRPTPADRSTSPTVTGAPPHPSASDPDNSSTRAETSVSEQTLVDPDARNSDTVALPVETELPPRSRVSALVVTPAILLVVTAAVYLLSGRATLVVDVPTDLVVRIDDTSVIPDKGPESLRLASGSHRISVEWRGKAVPFDSARGRFVSSDGQVLVFLDDAPHASDELVLDRGVEAQLRFRSLTNEEAAAEVERLARESVRVADDGRWNLVDEHLLEIDRLATPPSEQAAAFLRAAGLRQVNAFTDDAPIAVLDAVVRKGPLECTPAMLDSVLQRVRTRELRMRRAFPDTLVPDPDEVAASDVASEPSVPAEMAERIEAAFGHVDAHGAIVQWMAEGEFAPLAAGLAKCGYEMRSFRPFGDDNGVHVAATWRRGDRQTVHRMGIEESRFDEVHREQVAAGRRLIDVGGYVDDSEGEPVDRYFGLWVEDDEPAVVTALLGMTEFERTATFNRLRNSHIVDVSQMFEDSTGNERHCELWRENDGVHYGKHYGSPAAVRRGLRESGFLGVHYVDHSTSSPVEGIRTSAVFSNPDGHRDMRLMFGVAVEDVRWLSQHLVRAGYEPISLSVVAMPNGTLVAAGVWSLP